MGERSGTVNSRRFRRMGTVAVLAVAGLVVTPAAALAKPYNPTDSQISAAQQARDAASAQMASITQQVAVSQAAVDTANAKSALALDTYQGKQADYETAQTAADAAAAVAKKADADLAQAHAELTAFARRSYMAGSTAPQFQALLSADGPAQLLERATLLEAAGAHHTDVVVQFTGAQKQAAASSAAAQTSLGQAAALKDQAAQALSVAEQAETAARQQAVQVQAQQTQLQAQLTAAQQTLSTYIGERAAADQYAQQQAAAQQAAEQQAAHDAAQVADQTNSTPVDANSGDAGPGSASAAETAISAAKRWLGTPYAWGGGSLTGPSRGIGIDAGVVGFDCSGLTRYAYYQAGISIPRNSTAQYAALPKVSRDNLQRGDLVFWAFDTSNPATIHHVAIYLGGGQIIEAPESGETVRVTAMRWPGYIGAARPSA